MTNGEDISKFDQLISKRILIILLTAIVLLTFGLSFGPDNEIVKQLVTIWATIVSVIVGSFSTNINK